jgi:hypothetical protein
VHCWLRGAHLLERRSGIDVAFANAAASAGPPHTRRAYPTGVLAERYGRRRVAASPVGAIPRRLQDSTPQRHRRVMAGSAPLPSVAACKPSDEGSGHASHSRIAGFRIGQAGDRRGADRPGVWRYGAIAVVLGVGLLLVAAVGAASGRHAGGADGGPGQGPAR